MQYQIKLWDAPPVCFTGAWLPCSGGDVVVRPETSGDACAFTCWLAMALPACCCFACCGACWAATPPFARFVRGPGAMLAYLRGSLPEHHIPGHNPLGAADGAGAAGFYWVFRWAAACLPLMSIRSCGMARWPKLINSDLSRPSGWHKISFKLLLAAVGLHLSAIVFYRLIKRRNLVAAMLSGWQTYANITARAALCLMETGRAVRWWRQAWWRGGEWLGRLMIDQTSAIFPALACWVRLM